MKSGEEVRTALWIRVVSGLGCSTLACLLFNPAMAADAIRWLCVYTLVILGPPRIKPDGRCCGGGPMVVRVSPARDTPTPRLERSDERR